MGRSRLVMAALLALASSVVVTSPPPATAASAAELRHDASAALSRLYRSTPSAKILGGKARAILVFPTMVKAGFMFGGQIGEGVLLKGGKVSGYYNSVAASYGFQAGIQSFSYALFFMNDEAVRQFEATEGFEIGVGPSVVIVDTGMARSITSNTITSDVYAFIFGQRGLMAGVGIQGSKITRISK